MKKTRVLVFGCGPAGLFAAHAAIQAGCLVTIVSKKRRSEMFGAQYLHSEIPGLACGAQVSVAYELRGTAQEYREKVYGEQKVQVSPEALLASHPAWDIRKAYYDAWDFYHNLVVDAPVLGGIDFDEAVHYYDSDLVVSTLPLPMICLDQEKHTFKSENVYAIGDAPERGIFCPVSTPPNTVICDGTKDVGWYRSANVFNYQTAEWPGNRKPPLDNIAPVTKPISTTCDCHPKVMRAGRYGTWTKGVLSDMAYDVTSQVLRQLP